MVHVPAFDLPLSSFIDLPTRLAILAWEKWNEDIARDCPGHWTDSNDIPAVRRFYDQRFFPRPLERLRSLYDVCIEQRVIGGVPSEVFTPQGGVTVENRGRVLINLHGGAFAVGARYGSRLESIPIAAIGRIQVVGVDYRMGPEFGFPAATDDVVAVYEQLLHEVPATSIGIFGSSAGALLAAQVIARLHTEKMPIPAALAMLSGAGAPWTWGDSIHVSNALNKAGIRPFHKYPYFKDADASDPLVFPILCRTLLAKFPPSLLIAGTREAMLSSVVHMHSRLVDLGIPAELHLWEGLGHAFFYDPDLQPSREVHDVTVRFFLSRLGSSNAGI